MAVGLGAAFGHDSSMVGLPLWRGSLGKCATDGNGREQPAAGEEPGLGQAGVGAAGAAGSGGKRQAAGGAGAARSHRHDSTRRKGGPYTTRRTGAGAGLGGVAATHGALVV